MPNKSNYGNVELFVNSNGYYFIRDSKNPAGSIVLKGKTKGKFAKNKNWEFIGASRVENNYYILVEGKLQNELLFKVHQFDLHGRISKAGPWMDQKTVSEYSELFGVKFTKSGKQTSSGVSTTSINNSKYSRRDGYGEIDIEEALEVLLGKDLPAVPDVGGGQFTEYGLDRVGAPEAWNEGYSGQGVVIAVLDTGVDVNHVELYRNIWVNSDEIAGDGVDNDNNGYVDDVRGWDFANKDNTTEDIQGHGTHVAGIIASEKNNIGMTGVAFNAKIMPVKVLGDDGSGNFDDVARGIIYAVDNGADIINMSLGGGYQAVPVVNEAIKYASEAGVIVVMAAGNDGALEPNAPANYASEHGIAVGSIGIDGRQSNFSNKAGGATDYEGDGTKYPLYVTAPGEDIWSSLPNNYLGKLSGTSMATPFVSGAIALLLEARPNLTVDQIRVVLANTAD